MKHSMQTRANDLLPRYMWMGDWRSRVLDKKNKGKSEKTKLSRTYVAVPPPNGWPGGRPEENGYRVGGKK